MAWERAEKKKHWGVGRSERSGAESEENERGGVGRQRVIDGKKNKKIKKQRTERGRESTGDVEAVLEKKKGRKAALGGEKRSARENLLAGKNDNGDKRPPGENKGPKRRTLGWCTPMQKGGESITRQGKKKTKPGARAKGGVS